MGFSRQEYWSGVPLPSPMTNLDSILKSRDITLPAKGHSQSYCFSSSFVWMKKAGCWRIDAFKLRRWRRLESPLDCKEIKPVNPKGNQPWIFIGRTDAEAETPRFWPPDVKNWLSEKGPDAGEDCRQEEKGMTEDEMVEWHHWLNGLEFEQTLGDGEGQGSLVCCSPWGYKESDTTEWLNNNKK